MFFIDILFLKIKNIAANYILSKYVFKLESWFGKRSNHTTSYHYFYEWDEIHFNMSSMFMTHWIY